jgi:hypothetical protein
MPTGESNAVLVNWPAMARDTSGHGPDRSASGGPSGNGADASSGREGLRRGLVALAVLVGLGLFVLAGLLADTDASDDTIPITGGAVETLTPAEDEEVLQQQRVEIDLATGWTGNLTINGIVIPEDQLLRNEAVGTIAYQPTEGQIIASLAPGPNCAEATIWPIAEGPDGPSEQTTKWCFNAT